MESSSSSSPNRGSEAQEIISPNTVRSSSAGHTKGMEIDSEGDVEIISVDMKDSEVLESKRKAGTGAVTESAISRKKVKMSKEVIKETAKVIELKGNKLILSQKSINSDKLNSTLRSTIAFTDYVVTWLETAGDAPFDTYPAEHWPVIARIVHESDKTLPVITAKVRSTIIETITGAMPVDEDSQEQVKPTIAWEVRFPLAPIKAIISQIAERTNYGLDLTDIPDGPNADATEIPATLQILRWEIQDTALLPSELATKLIKRKEERVEAKALAKTLFFALSETEQIDILSKPTGKKGKAATKKDDDFAPVASGSGTAKKEKVVKVKAVKGKKVLSAEEEEALEEKARVKAEKEAAKEIAKVEKEAAKAEKDASKEAKKLEKDAKDAERDEKKMKVDEKKAKKAKEDADKKAKSEKATQAANRQSGMFMGFFGAKSASPAPQAAKQSSDSPAKIRESDFNATFKLPQAKNNVIVVPLNRFTHLNRNKKIHVEIDSVKTLTREDGLDQLQSHLKSYKIPAPPLKPTQPRSMREIVQEINDSHLLSTDARAAYADLSNRKKIPVKVLQFADDHRPGYVGTWTKVSKVVTGRRPFGQETALLRYDYDSEEDWNEEPDEEGAEDLGSGGELSGGDESDALSDDWMCDDDEVEFAEGHVAEDSPGPEDDPDVVVIGGEMEMAARKVADRESKSKAIKENPKKRKAGPFLPVVRGPAWEKEIGVVSEEGFKGMGMRFLNDATAGLNPLTFVSKSFPTGPAKVVKTPLIPTIASTKAATSKSGIVKIPKLKSTDPTIEKGPKVKSTKTLPASLLPEFIRLIHGSILSKPLLREYLWTEMEKKDSGISKAALDNSFRDSGAKKLKESWIVPDDKLAMYSTTLAMEIDE